jgi:hypothetical protein
LKTARSRRRYVHPLLIDHGRLARSHRRPVAPLVRPCSLAFYGGRRRGNLYVRAGLCAASCSRRPYRYRPVRRWPAYNT